MKKCQRTPGEKFSLSSCLTPAVTIADMEDSSPARLGPRAAQPSKSQSSRHCPIPFGKRCGARVRVCTRVCGRASSLLAPCQAGTRVVSGGWDPGTFIFFVLLRIFYLCTNDCIFPHGTQNAKSARGGNEALHTPHVHRHSHTQTHTCSHVHTVTRAASAVAPQGGVPGPIPAVPPPPGPSAQEGLPAARSALDKTL